MAIFLKQIWNDLKGNKTYIVGVAAIIVGIYTKSPDLVTLGLGLIGIRHGISTEIAKIITSQNIKTEAIKDAPAITQEVVRSEIASPQPSQPVTP